MSDERWCRLEGVPYFFQGSADGLCTYYSMSMLLAAVVPQVRTEVSSIAEEGSSDPVLRALKRKRGSRLSSALGRMVAEGLHVKPCRGALSACGLLNQVCAQELGANSGPYFEHWEFNGKRRYEKRLSLKALAAKTIERGLPALIGGRGNGVLRWHTVVLIGYYSDGRENGLIVQDPGNPVERWREESVEALCEAPLDVVCPGAQWPFPGPPLDKVVSEGGECFIERWKPNKGYVRWTDSDARDARGRAVGSRS